MSRSSVERALQVARTLGAGPSSRYLERWHAEGSIQASVLVAIVDGASPHVLLTRRATNLSVSGGEISFPGGIAEPGDITAIGTGVREFCEEMGTQLQDEEVIGCLPVHAARTRHLVTPVVAWVERSLRLEPNPREVADVLMVPLRYVLSSKSYCVETTKYRGCLVKTYVLRHGDWFVYGTTAAVLAALCRAVLATDAGTSAAWHALPDITQDI